MAQIKQRDLFVRRLSIYRKDLKKGFRGGFQIYESPHACKGMQDGLGVWIPRRGFPDSSTGFLIFFFNWNLDFGFQLFVGFRIP